MFLHNRVPSHGREMMVLQVFSHLGCKRLVTLSCGLAKKEARWLCAVVTLSCGLAKKEARWLCAVVTLSCGLAKKEARWLCAVAVLLSHEASTWRVACCQLTWLVVVCFPQFDDQPQSYECVLRYLNTAFTILFTIECILKLMAFGIRVRSMACRRLASLSPLALPSPALVPCAAYLLPAQAAGRHRMVTATPAGNWGAQPGSLFVQLTLVK